MFQMKEGLTDMTSEYDTWLQIEHWNGGEKGYQRHTWVNWEMEYSSRLDESTVCKATLL